MTLIIRLMRIYQKYAIKVKAKLEQNCHGFECTLFLHLKRNCSISFDFPKLIQYRARMEIGRDLRTNLTFICYRIYNAVSQIASRSRRTGRRERMQTHETRCVCTATACRAAYLRPAIHQSRDFYGACLGISGVRTIREAMWARCVCIYIYIYVCIYIYIYNV